MCSGNFTYRPRLVVSGLCKGITIKSTKVGTFDYYKCVHNKQGRANTIFLRSCASRNQIDTPLDLRRIMYT